MEKHATDVSIIVPTKNSYETLKACLESIVSSGYPFKELIIIDSTNDDSLRKRNKELTERWDGKYNYEPRQRLAVARNSGIRISSGDIVVFADDDFIVDKDWLKNLVKNYEDSEVVCCTGRMLSYRNDEVSELYERFASFDRGEKRRVFTRKDKSIFLLLKVLPSLLLARNRSLQDKYPVTGAIGAGFCSFRKQIFDEAGYFDEDLGRGTHSVGEDIDMFYRILKTKYKIVYEPTAIIYHNHPQTREDVLRFAFSRGANLSIWHTQKYYKDIYMLLCTLGSLFFSILALVRAVLKRDSEFTKIMVANLKGFLDGFRQTERKR